MAPIYSSAFGGLYGQLMRDYSSRAVAARKVAAPVQPAGPVPPIYSAASTAGQYPSAVQSFNTSKWGRMSPQQIALQLAKGYESSYAQAQRTNEQRYRDIFHGYQNRYDEGMAALQNWGQQETARQEQRFGQARGELNQRAVAQGMYGTSGAMLGYGLTRQQAGAQADLAERLNQQRLGYQTGLSGDVLKFMENRQDNYPYLQELSQLAYQIGELGQTQELPKATSYQFTGLNRSYMPQPGYRISSPYFPSSPVSYF